MKNKPYELMNKYLDFYENLLTDKQREVMNYYYREDYSLSEISEILNISRSAILDNVKRSSKLLENYEEKLNLYDKFEKRSKIYEEMNDKGLNKYTDKLIKIEG